MNIDRRHFIKGAGALLGASLIGKYGCSSVLVQDVVSSLANESLSRPADSTSKRAVDGLGTGAYPGKKLAMVVDVGACIGCRTCMWACKQENNVADAVSPPWIEVFELRDEVSVTGIPSLEELNKGETTSYQQSPRPGHWYLPVACNHCDNAPCVKVCPTGATYKDKDGLVLMDYDKCIGCRFCVVACPYGSRRFNWFKPELPREKVNPKVPVRPVGVAEKCTWCVHRIRRGELPRCVEVCPVQARRFGDLRDPRSEVSKILKGERSFRLLEEFNTRPNIIYIAKGKKYTR
ncbi:MAG: 4Fe-4S dicluster domain-containing protein [Chloroflexi bacterium]|nr:4Fe-4S dicluster domain-containing protein [Chloroflexota bacterium]